MIAVLLFKTSSTYPHKKATIPDRKTTKDYQSSELNLYRWYKRFLERYPDSNVSHRFFRKTFQQELTNLKFANQG